MLLAASADRHDGALSLGSSLGLTLGAGALVGAAMLL
jgi:hypothetical protein